MRKALARLQLAKCERAHANKLLKSLIKSTEMKIRVHAFITGRVQGVFFRSETCNKARELDLTGWVKNLEDPYVAFGDRDGGRRPSHGRVEAVFEGDKDKVEKIIEWAKKGPILAKVENVEVNFEEYRGEFKTFEQID